MNAKLVSEARDVEKPKEVDGPMMPTTWWPKLFNVSPGYTHILFLREDDGYLHTVGAYPAYDLEIPSQWLPVFVSQWNSGQKNGSDLFERLATIRLKIELEQMTSIRRNYGPRDMYDLIVLTSPFFIAGKLNSFCLQFPNPFGRYAACESTAREFPGRCSAYRLARVLDTKRVESGHLNEQLNRCEAREPERIQFSRSTNWQSLFWDREWRSTPERRRLTMRLYASARDTAFHKRSVPSRRFHGRSDWHPRMHGAVIQAGDELSFRGRRINHRSDL